MLKFFLIFLVFLFSKVNCECTSKQNSKADKAFHKLSVLSDPSFSYATDDATFNNICSNLKEQEKILKDFSRTCLNNLNRQIVGVLINGGTREIRSFCSAEKRKLFLSYANCGNTSKKGNGQCLNALTSQSKRIVNAPKDKKINYVCCSIKNFEKCTSDNLKRTKVCTQDAVTNFMKLVTGFIKDIKDVMCSKFKLDSDCLQSLNELNNLPVSYSSSKSSLLPLIKIVEDF